VKYAFIKDNHKAFSVQLCCELLKVSRSGYYGWLNHKSSQRELNNQRLDTKIKVLYAEHKQRSGSPRITVDLNASGEHCSENRVARRMKALGLRALAKRKFKVTTDSDHNKPVYENELNRDFTTTATNQKWAGDITYIHTQEGWLYLAIIIDLHSRAIIGWSMDKRMKAELVCHALKMALQRKHYPKKVLVHSDRGSQYCSKQYRKLIKDNQLVGSMSRKGNCWDNAISESFFHTLKIELVHQQCYLTRLMAKQSLFQTIEGYYNRKRRHSAIGYRYPMQVDMAA
jgi:transposase InsO family protein